MLNIKTIQSFILQISEAKGLSEDQVNDVLADALAAAYKKDYGDRDDRIEAKIDPKTGQVGFSLVKTIIDPNEVENKTIKFNTRRHIFLNDAKDLIEPVKRNSLEFGLEVSLALPNEEKFSRIAAQTAKQVIVQKLREMEKNVIFNVYKEKEGGVVTGTIQRIENKNIFVDLGKTTGILFRSETIPGEIYRVGQRLRFYVYAIENTPRGVEVYVSRSNPLFVPAILKMEVPEVSEGLIEIKGVARLAGTRTKVSIFSNVKGVDAVGSCIGPRGARVVAIINELSNERIDIIPWSEDPAEYIKNSMLPAKCLGVEIMPKRTAKVLVSEDQLPIALGRNGQNIKLAATLTGWKIDVRLADEPEAVVAGGVVEVEPEDAVELEADGVESDQSEVSSNE
ncbi:MAG: transcription termination factor NusA [Patescibacteria group bacterium]|nr:transcription termination factor NusA [Patescibacteria group bacterium]MCL5257951.1 transcription termination factor NusA [Patescibacteria group bacterium]